MRDFKVAAAFWIGLLMASGATLAQSYGRGRNVQFVDGATISPTSVQASGTVTAGSVVSNGNTSTQTLNVGTTSTTTRSHMLCEETIYTPADFNTKHAVFGRNATSGASSGGVWLSYHTGDNEGIIGALSPGTAWRPLSIAASSLKFRPIGGNATVTLGGGVTTTGAIEGSTLNATIASGSQAYTCTNVGCRLSLGNTGRYLVDDGTNLEFIAPLQATTFEATTASGATLRGGGASGPMLIEPTTADSQTSATVPAILIKPANAITAGDALLIVQNSAGTQRFRIRDDGNTFANQFIARYHFGDQTPVEIGTYMSPGAEKNPIQLTAVGNFTADDVNLVSIRNNTSTLVSAFSKDGLLRVNASNAAKPTCNATNRGRVFYLDGAATVADTYEICMKNSADAYAWKTIVTP